MDTEGRAVRGSPETPPPAGDPSPAPRFRGMPTVINAGVGGENTGEILARLDRGCLAHRPDLVILMAGTNDCCNSAKLCDPAVTAANYAALAGRILAAGRLVLATPIAMHPPYLRTRHPDAAYAGVPAVERLALARRALRALAGSLGTPLVELGAITAGAGLVGTDPRCWLMNEANAGRTDGVHPTADGYRAIAGAIAAVVLALRPRPERIVCLGDSITLGMGVPGEGTAEGDTYPAWLARILAAAD